MAFQYRYWLPCRVLIRTNFEENRDEDQPDFTKKGSGSSPEPLSNTLKKNWLTSVV